MSIFLVIPVIAELASTEAKRVNDGARTPLWRAAARLLLRPSEIGDWWEKN